MHDKYYWVPSDDSEEYDIMTPDGCLICSVKTATEAEGLLTHLNR